jgi:hypothetical protein
MSALGQKQTYEVHKVMSALPPKADMCSATSDVCFGPIADIRPFMFRYDDVIGYYDGGSIGRAQAFSVLLTPARLRRSHQTL